MHFFGSGKIFRSGTIRDAGAKFLATFPHQLFKLMVGTPHGSAGLGNFATLDQVTRFLWYLEMLGQHWVSADGKKHEGRAIHLQKTQW